MSVALHQLFIYLFLFPVNISGNFISLARPKKFLSESFLTVTNSGKADLFISAIEIAGVNADSFSQMNTCTGKIIPPKGSCAVTVTAQTSLEGKNSAALTINANIPGGLKKVNLVATVPKPKK